MITCDKHGQLADDGKCDVCEGRGLWECSAASHADIAAAMENEFITIDERTSNEWPGKLTRANSIQLIDRATDKDDPYWEHLVDDFYDEKTDTMPTIYHVLAALGVTEKEYLEATGEKNINWPK